MALRNQSGRRKRRLMSDMNVVPYIDVMLVLVVILMVAAPFVSVESRVVHILRALTAGRAGRLDELFSPEQELSATVATFLAVLELVRAGRLEIADDGVLTFRRGRLPRRAASLQEEPYGET